VALNLTMFNEWSSKEIYNNGFLLAEKLGMKTKDPKTAYDFLKTFDVKEIIEACVSVRISTFYRIDWIAGA